MSILSDEATVEELSVEDARRLFNDRATALLGRTGAKFVQAFESGSYPDDWDKRVIGELEMLLPFAS